MPSCKEFGAVIGLTLLAATAVHAATIAVDDSGDAVALDNKVTLREALLSFAIGADWNNDVALVRTDAYGNADTLRFAIGTGAQSISIAAPLPAVRGVLIDGSSQPGWVNQNLIALDGSDTVGDGLVLLEGSQLKHVDLDAFGGNGLHIDDEALFGHDFESAAMPEPVLPENFVTVVLDHVGSFDNVGHGVLIDPGTAAQLDSVRTESNQGDGMRVRGGLVAADLVSGHNHGDGVLVDSAEKVEMVRGDFQFNGLHPTLPLTPSAGIRALRASKLGLMVDPPFNNDPAPGLQIRDLGTAAHNGGDGVVLGDSLLQAGVVQAWVSDMQIHDNGATGIRVVQRDADAHRTAIGIFLNNMYDNADSGLHLSTAYMFWRGFTDRRVFSGNYVHHNAVTPADQCSVAAAMQTAAQIVVDGPVAATQAEQDACVVATTFSTCLALNDPNEANSNGINNHCVWTGVACTVAWGLGGREGGESCDSSQNRIFAYVNDQNLDPATQKGISAFNGANVNARRNTWGSGGATNGVFASPGSVIDPNDDCGSISTCP